MYWRHSPVVKCQKIANTHSVISAQAIVACQSTARSKPSSE
jgi:hypothetical protein